MQIKTITSKATRTVYTILRQISTLVPRKSVNDTAKAHKIKWWARHRRQKAAAKLHTILCNNCSKPKKYSQLIRL